MKSAKGLIYTLIARQGVILVEEVNKSHGIAHSGNISQIAHIILPKLPTTGNYCYKYDNNYSVSVFNKEGLSYIVLSENRTPAAITFSFLRHVSDEFYAIFGTKSESGQPYMFTSFAIALNLLMNRYNDPEKDGVGKVQKQMDDVKDVMMSNIDKLLQRGEKLDLIIDRAEDLAETATLFQQDARAIKRKTVLEQWRLYLTILVIILIIAAIIVIPLYTSNKKEMECFVCLSQAKTRLTMTSHHTMEVSMEYQKLHTFEDRKREADSMKQKWPNQVPIICEKDRRSEIPILEKKKSPQTSNSI